MRTMTFDIETNGLLPHTGGELDRFLGAWVKDGDVWKEYTDAKELGACLDLADRIVGHNIVEYDLPALEFLCGWKPRKGVDVYDTFIVAQLTHLNLKAEEFDLEREGRLKDFPKALFGSHKLKAWGMRLGNLKGSPELDGGWYNAQWNAEMSEYCKQDVLVTHKLYEYLLKEDRVPDSVRLLEQNFAHNMLIQEQNGVGFDLEKAKGLLEVLIKERDEVCAQLQEVFPPKSVFKRHGYVFFLDAEGKRRRSKEKHDVYEDKVFNPSSNDDIANRLISEFGWRPTEKTTTGKVKVDEETLSGIVDKYPIVKPLLRYLMLAKRIGQLGSGKENLIKACRKGRIHGRVRTLGTVSTRCAHTSPNLAQVPSSSSPFGEEFRSLFGPGEGRVLVGCDAEGLELRCLSHYIAKWDGGAYGERVINGNKDLGTDIHTLNMKAAGLKTRDQAKTFIYAWLYGAGDTKIGTVIGKGAKAGKLLKQRFFQQTPGLPQLDAAVKKAAARGFLIGIDGRYLPVRAAHAALNLLLQGCGAIAMKKAQTLLQVWITEENLDAYFMLNIHDEFQLSCDPECAERVAELGKRSIEQAGIELGMRVPLAGDAKIGLNWAETH